MAQITIQNYHDCYEYGKKVANGIITKKTQQQKFRKME